MAFLNRLIFALMGMAFAIVFTLGVLCWLALYVVFASVRWLVTGQKPQVVMMWQQIQAMRQGMPGRPRTSDQPSHEAPVPPRRSSTKTEAVEDVVVREIHHQPHVPKD